MKLLQPSRRAVILVGLGIIFLVPLLFPVYWIISASVQNLSTIFAKAPSVLPGSVFGQNYQYAFNNIIGNIGVSLLIALCVVALSWLLGVPAAHALTRRGGRLTAAVVLAMRASVPLAVPAIMTVGLFSFLGAWGDFVNALTLNATGGPQPLTLGLYKFVQQHSTDLGAIFAATVIAAVPTTIILFVGQRWIKGGLRAGALKG